MALRFTRAISGVLCVFISTSFAFSQSGDKNFIISRTYKRATTTPGGSGSILDATQEISYLDGLGRPMQAVSAHGSPQLSGGTPSDLVTHTEYDNFGRVSKVYLPVPNQGNGNFSGSAASDVFGYYQNGSIFCGTSTRAYAETQYEASPLNRPTRKYAPGTDRAVEITYGVNGGNEVKQYDVSGDNLVNNNVYYQAGALSYTETKDENGNRTREYKDKGGKVILKRSYLDSGQLDTYYVYNDLDQLKFVLQPKFQDDANTDRYAFRYSYNDRGLVQSKYVPGGGTTTMEYDGQDRLTYTTDGRGKRIFYTYDGLNRPTGTRDRTNGADEGLTVISYDNYNSRPGGHDFVNIGSNYPATTAAATGKITVEARRVLKPDGNYDAWLYTTTYYNERYQVIQVVRDLYDLGTGDARERTTYDVRFDGLVLRKRVDQNTQTGSHAVETTITYDHNDRVLSSKYTIYKNGNYLKEAVVAASRYNPVGQLKNRYLHSTGNESYREQLDYCYNVRSFIKSINGKTSASDNFGLNIRYDDARDGNYNQFNGNISEISWRQVNGSWPGFRFNYDQLSRMTNSTPFDGNNLSEAVAYDKNGNITSLQRSGSGGQWDNLTYSYFKNGNQGDFSGNRLMRVEDVSGNSNGFQNGNNGSDDYDYDGNGNATKDLNKGLSSIEYNILNLVRKVTFANNPGKSYEYHYDASGTKIRLNNSGTNTKYAGIFEYDQNNYVTRIATEEGQIAVTSNASNYEFQYYLKDHLGNVRVVINEGGSVVQETEYFPFGMPVVRTQGANKYLYNGKEQQPETGYLDYGARMYDGGIGRWFVPDAMSDTYSNFTSYNYVFNSPLSWDDPDGRCPTCPQGDEARDVYSPGAIVSNQYGSWKWTGSEWVTLGTLEVPSGSQVMAPVSGILEWIDQVFNGNRTFGLKEVNSDGVLSNKLKPITGLPPDVGVSRIRSATELAALARPSAIALTQRALEHVISRHWPTSAATNAGKFAQNISEDGLKEMVEIARAQGTIRANTHGRAGIIIEHTFEHIIGINIQGSSTSSIRIIVGDSGNLITAFPF
ncbi:DUF6443 domain-containing protein [Siphonobacter aquaeclarae]|uniref:RHS repeat-associated core domain-containing protein n=1 Tax=Siphonobacter aquaeclarae TaxID=563176 RepID=A0A1G9JTT8_9BACT|nr:DUF6443 domain-containing protein [Siphonobacter aquaeclarae]SDL40554.1 RHS repeat-associated core domain-containing protein [Siphonobacter aquaeclarae]